MATITAGTTASTSLTALTFQPTMSDADAATIRANIKDDILAGNLIWPDAFSKVGLLHVPNRGVLKVFPGDIVAVDTHSGWPVLLAKFAFTAAGTVWNHS